MAKTITYNIAKKEGEAERIELFFENGTEITGEMFDGHDVVGIPEGKYGYFVRHDDNEWSDPVSVKKERGFTCNFMGTIVTDSPVNFGDKDELIITDWGWLDD